jgi:hypothetical protein
MTVMPLVFLFASLLILSAASVEALSNAARYLIDQQIAEACEWKGGAGIIDPAAVIERDLTGDGRADLIISHEGIVCADGGRSSHCGMQVCSVMIYVRRGALLEVAADDKLGMGVSVGEGEIPTIHMLGHGGHRTALRWDGQALSPSIVTSPMVSREVSHQRLRCRQYSSAPASSSENARARFM